MALKITLSIAVLRKLKRALEGEITCRNSTPMHDLHLRVCHVLDQHDKAQRRKKRTP